MAGELWVEHLLHGALPDEAREHGKRNTLARGFP
jgi:hypothetical protein